MKLLLLLPTFLGLTAATNTTTLQPRGTIHLSSILNPILSFLECSQSSPEIQLLCHLISLKLHSTLSGSNIQISRTALLFTYNDPTNLKIDTGHSCTVTAEITHSLANAALLSDTSLSFSGNPLSLSNPALFVADLPVSLYAKSDIKQKFGSRVLGKCISAGSDSFSVSGSLSTRANIAVLFTFAPSPIKRDSAGNYILTIRPITKVAADLKNTDIKFNVSGVSFLNGLVTAVLGGTSSLLKAVTGIIKGDGLKAVWKDVLASVVDVTAGTLLGMPFDTLDNLVELLANSWVEEKQKGLSTAYSGELEKNLRGKISEVLGLDAKGERQFVLKKDFVELVGRFGEGTADVWLAPKPAGFCGTDADCDDRYWCNGVEKCVNEVCVAGVRRCLGGEGMVCNEARKSCVMNCGGNGRMCPRGRKD
ncbi:hypothetical protein QBC38DRAFT_515517 [Podospora fimiseda]|uniref:Uncharacterized protein n=1 Tax=Podospora fimiseda TaxID=252190 RepID=A0AAN7GR76_9PEZI|nr:hypothetical protein QBC38DRAFT_515517 [Podospora fimiseda]